MLLSNIYKGFGCMTLYNFIKQYSYGIDELTVWDIDYDIAIYFYSDILNPNNSWDKSMAVLAKKLTVKEVRMDRGGVAVNLSQLIERNLNKPVMAQLFNRVNTDAIMYDMTNIMAGYVGEKWMETFVNSLT